MSNALDDKLAGALALAISQRPRANLQQIARSAGISKATLNRIAPTRKDVITMLMERATTHLQEALAKADLATPPFAEALGRLTANVMQGRAFFMFWNTAQWVEIMDDQEHALDELPIPSFYGEALEEFFLRGQKAGVFRIDLPAKWLVKAYDFLLYAAVESAHRGEIATAGMESLVDKTFLRGAVEPVSIPAGAPLAEVAVKGEAV
ncbi:MULTISPECIES: transcriptional regulator [Gammaproteobacteria]|uniref:Transcriptional regulator n=1 Tax=Serratia marcescens TaxID=615 RepID=A0A2F0PDX2_SERMA|nr:MULTISPECIES: transcriptional regulator [Enterobacterales]HBV8601701.1 TetR/AcrR family transcriptional regulator [Klebsiella oxytoca]HCK5591124.1 transcriptional regulator [Pseudomonas aeruginosa]HCL5941079.1 TetR/AcrR family transcriptional regulator [Citrobacter freundii]MDM1787157.1 TetR/AcrR family transcriptional regulator [Serratia marcescens]MDM1794423.1 TetR/AcrR family transcriptional regulator [Serratia marcescens]